MENIKWIVAKTVNLPQTNNNVICLLKTFDEVVSVGRFSGGDDKFRSMYNTIRKNVTWFAEIKPMETGWIDASETPKDTLSDIPSFLKDSEGNIFFGHFSGLLNKFKDMHNKTVKNIVQFQPIEIK